VQTRIQKYFICKEETKQGYDKKTHPKLVLKKLKVMGNFIFIYTHWALNSKKNSNFFNLHVAHVHPCALM
jgi:hypothetical protein